jgi:hypothetical protein
MAMCRHNLQSFLEETFLLAQEFSHLTAWFYAHKDLKKFSYIKRKRYSFCSPWNLFISTGAELFAAWSLELIRQTFYRSDHHLWASYESALLSLWLTCQMFSDTSHCIGHYCAQRDSRLMKDHWNNWIHRTDCSSIKWKFCSFDLRPMEI